jgi:hypothetical protein
MVIAHPGAMTSRAVCGDSTKRMVSRAEVRLALAVLTTERNAENHSQCREATRKSCNLFCIVPPFGSGIVFQFLFFDNLGRGIAHFVVTIVFISFETQR